jgi:hypothetical protein
LPLWIEEQSGLTISDMRVKVERMAEKAQQRGIKLLRRAVRLTPDPSISLLFIRVG